MVYNWQDTVEGLYKHKNWFHNQREKFFIQNQEINSKYWIMSGKAVVMKTTSYLPITEASFMKFEHIINKMFTDILVYIGHVSWTAESVY